jgi:hypothetical protein
MMNRTETQTEIKPKWESKMKQTSNNDLKKLMEILLDPTKNNHNNI